MHALIAAAHERRLHALICAIDAPNAGSIALRRRLGFQQVGTLPRMPLKTADRPPRWR